MLCYGSASPTWWRHQMETFSALLAICAGNSPVPVNSPHKGQWRGALMFTFICARINGWVNNRGAGDLRRYRTHYDVIVMEGKWRIFVSLNLFIIGTDNGLLPLGATPLSESKLTYHQLDPDEQISVEVEFESKYDTFHTRKWIWKFRLQNRPQWVIPYFVRLGLRACNHRI